MTPAVTAGIEVCRESIRTAAMNTVESAKFADAMLKQGDEESALCAASAAEQFYGDFIIRVACYLALVSIP